MFRFFYIICLCLLFNCQSNFLYNNSSKPKIIVSVVVDQMRYDYLTRLSNKFSPLVKVCKEYGSAMRIGTNHGSLSDRILSRYGDTPLGMVESAMEFLRICGYWNYH